VQLKAEFANRVDHINAALKQIPLNSVYLST